MVQVITIRHANSVGNKFGIRQGQVDFPLSKKGLKQCKRLPEVVDEFNISHVYHSDLRRSSETVEFSGLDENIPRKETDNIREMDFGRLSGIAADYQDEELPYSLDEHPKIDEGWPEGENYVEFHSRVREFCQQVAVTHSDEETILAVVHQGPLMAIRDIARGASPLGESYEESTNLGGFVFEIEADGFGGDGELFVEEVRPINEN